MNWRVKAVMQKALSALPLGTSLNDALQRNCGGLRNFAGHVASKVVDDWVPLCHRIFDVEKNFQDSVMVEIGTGWHPCLPVCFHLAGAGRCITFDLRRCLSSRLSFRMLQALKPHLPLIAETAGIALADVERRYRVLCAAESIDDLLCRARIDYRAPADATATALPAASVDIVFSNSVLEHVSLDALRGMMAESERILRPNGIAVHAVNCGDHYAYFDRSITQANYLQFTDREWQRWNTPLQYQNRLRPIDFLRSAEHAGLQIVRSWSRPRPEIVSQLRGMPIAAEFRDYTAEQLATTSVTFIASPANAHSRADDRREMAGLKVEVQ